MCVCVFGYFTFVSLCMCAEGTTFLLCVHKLIILFVGSL